MTKPTGLLGMRMLQICYEDTMKVKVREIMPASMFGEQGPFRGRKWGSWGEMRKELVEYLEDRPMNRSSGAVQNLNQVNKEYIWFVVTQMHMYTLLKGGSDS